MGITEPVEKGASLGPQSISIFIWCITIIAVNTHQYHKGFTHSNLKTRQDIDCITTDTSGMGNQSTERLGNIPRATARKGQPQLNPWQHVSTFSSKTITILNRFIIQRTKSKLDNFLDDSYTPKR